MSSRLSVYLSSIKDRRSYLLSNRSHTLEGMIYSRIMNENLLLPRIIRLTGIQGFEGRANDIVYCRPFKPNEMSSIVVYFGGDVQDFTENMNSHRDNKQYIKWNLENIALLLRTKFLDSHIIVVRPSRMEFKTFSCFQNFVPCNTYGVPIHEPQYNSLCHLDEIIRNITQKLRNLAVDEENIAPAISNAPLVHEELQNGAIEETSNVEYLTTESLDLNIGSIKIVGFSKGCVVLNQFLYEFDYYKKFPDDMGLMKRISDIYWIDGGHNGGKNTWITSKPLLETLSQLAINIHIHVSPYQIQDDRRPWIRKEEKKFYETIMKLGSPVQHTVHFEDLPPNIISHFELLNVFKT